MDVTGYQIRRVLKSLEMKRDALLEQFQDSLKTFPGEKKASPRDIMETLDSVEEKIAQLQALQVRYNDSVEVEAGGKTMSLTMAVKRSGSLGRAANLWKQAAKSKGDREGYYEQVRREGELHQEKVLTPLEATNMAIEAEKLAGSYRAAIAEGNSIAVEFEDTDFNPSLLRE